ncbi:MAG: acetyltransferase [Rhodospirillales bacterium]|nr:acetyltransferase [Rhodospirillales bacterium]
MTEKVFIFGCGGHAKVVHDVIEAQARYEVAAYVDAEPNQSEFRGLPLYDEQYFLDNFEDQNIAIAIGENSLRKKIFENLKSRGFQFPNIVHPSAILSQSVELTTGTVVMPNVVVNSSAVIGDSCMLNTSSVVEHDCQLGDFVSIAPKAVICGGCEIGEGTYIGANASIIHSKTIGPWSVVAAQAGVINDVPAHCMVAGVPAILKKKIEPGQKIL